MPAYDALWFKPPAPLARVTLRNRDTGITVADVPMLLDSGADVTLVPQAVVGELGLAPSAERLYELIGFDGSISFAQIVQLDLLFLGRAFRGEFLLIDQKWGILGRNILNAVPLLLDGPHLNWDELRRG